MAMTGEQIEEYLLSLDRTEALAETARSNVAHRRIAEEAEEARAKAIGSGIEGSDSDLESATAKSAAEDPVTSSDERNIIQKMSDWMKTTTREFMKSYSEVMNKISKGENELRQVKERVKALEEAKTTKEDENEDETVHDMKSEIQQLKEEVSEIRKSQEQGRANNGNKENDEKEDYIKGFQS